MGEGFRGKCDGLIDRGFGTFAIKGINYAPQACWVTLVRVRFNSLDPLLCGGVCNIVADFSVEFGYTWVSGGSGVETICR